MPPARRRFSAAVLALAAALVGPVARAQEAQRPSETELLETFLRVAPHVDSRVPSAPPRLTRWVGPMRVGVIAERIAVEQLDFIEEQATRLQRITGHEVVFVRGGTAVAVILVSDDPFLDLEREDLRRRLGPLVQPAVLASARAVRGRLPCYSVTLHAENKAVSAIGGVMTKLGDEVFRACIVTVLAEMMGLRSNAATAGWSVMRRAYDLRALSPDDAIMLRLLYDARLSPGMTADEIRAVAPTIIAELRGRR